MISQAPMSEATLDKLQRDTFNYFLKETNRANGMVPDNTRQGAHASIAPIGLPWPLTQSVSSADLSLAPKPSKER